MKILRRASAVLIFTAMLLLYAARSVSGFAVWYTEHIYRILAGVIGRFFGMFPFSVVEFGLYGTAAVFIACLIRGIIRRDRAYWKKFLSGLVFYAAVLLFLYASCCGVNYYRTPFSSYYFSTLNRMSAEDVVNKEELVRLCEWLTDSLGSAAAELEEDGDAWRNLGEKGVRAMRTLGKSQPVLDVYYPRAKPVTFSVILSVQQLAGVYSPFTVEANYNRDMVSYNLPHTICHELSHLSGFMREDEANFIGYLACIGSEDEDLRYSGYVMGWIYAGNALAKQDYEKYVELYMELPERVRDDLAENNQFWDRYQGRVAETSTKMNDTYLKVNGQSEGVKTYGRVVDLMLWDYCSEHEG